jgi:hypothetical protein
MQVHQMNNKLAILLNGISQLEYDRDKPLPEMQRQYLDKMDERMDAGITLGDRHIDKPDRFERAQFVAVYLVDAIKAQNEQMAAAMCSYLADRVPDLMQVKADEHDEDLSVEFVFDQPHANQVEVKFFDNPPGKPKAH